MNMPLAARNCLVRASLILLAMLLCAGRAHGAPQGELDATFGENGRMTLQLADSQFGRAIAQQPADGKLLFPGYYSRDPGGVDFAVLRLDPDGTVDSTFGINGTATVDFGSADAFAARLAVQPDGRIIVVGSAQMGAHSSVFALARLNSDGTVDSTFGNNGLFTLDLGGVTESISDINLLPNGQFVVLGTTDANGHQDAVFARFGANGALDTTFGNGPVAGTTIVGVIGKNDELHSMIRQSDGKFVACGVTVHVDNGVDYVSDMLAIRVNANGSADASFGSNGISQIVGTWQFAGAQACTAMPDGSLMLAGFRGGPGMVDPALIRLLPDGRRDTTFGSAGLSGFWVDHIAYAQAITILDDGSIGVTGFTIPLHNTNLPTDMFVARVDPDSGTLDSTFGMNGVTIIDFGLSSESALVKGSGLIAQADGKIISVGHDLRSSLALARVDPAGSGSAGFAGFLGTSATVSETTTGLVVTVRRTGGSAGSLSVDYTTIADSALTPNDFATVSGTLTWPAGDMNPKSIMVPISNDGMTEGVERFSIVLSNSTGGLAASEFEAAIVDQVTAPPPPPPQPQPQPAPRNGGSGGGGATGIEAPLLGLIWAIAARRRRDGLHRAFS